MTGIIKQYHNYLGILLSITISIPIIINIPSVVCPRFLICVSIISLLHGEKLALLTRLPSLAEANITYFPPLESDG